MFEAFEAFYKESSRGAEQLPVRNTGLGSLDDFFRRYAGVTFNRGVYRALNRTGAATFKSWIDESFPEYRSKVVPFGFDWLGRVWSTSIGGSESDSFVYLFDPADAAFGVPFTFRELHDVEFVEYHERSLLTSLFQDWSQGDDFELGYTECAGYVKPLRLGGTVTVDNLERVDMNVNWHLSSQIRVQVDQLGDGETISGFTISD